MKLQHTLLTALVCIFLAATASASGPVADVNIAASGVYFQTKVSGDFELKVSGPAGYSMSKTFTDSAPSFSVADTDGANGTYNYELVNLPHIPEEADRAEIALRSALVQSGAFTIAGGSVVDPTHLEQSLEKTQTFVDDVTVQGSQCVGFDCTSSESYGFDTLRLKENNLRIHFDDTSSSASFPGNDWRLIANDSSNGGANYLAIEDATGGKTPFKVEAGAKTNALYIEDDGDVGVGTTSPAVRMQLVKGDSPALRLEQDGSSGFTPQSWDVAGNETNFFIRDVTNGSKLPFRIKPGAPDNSLFVAADGNVGIGTDSPQARFHMLNGGSTFSLNASTHAAFQNNASDSDAMILSIIGGAANTSQLAFGRGGGSNSELEGRIRYVHSTDSMEFYTGFGTSAVMTLDGDATNAITTSTGAVLTASGMWNNASSRSLKHGIQTLSGTDAMATLTGLEPVTYRYNASPSDPVVGFIAEDVPELVATPGRKSLSAMDIVAVLTKATQEQQSMILKLESRLAELEGSSQP